MNALLERAFRHRSILVSKLPAYGFSEQDGAFCYRTRIAEGQMELTVTVDGRGEISVRVTDSDTGEEYTLYLAEGAAGSFVGRVRADVEAVLWDVAERCCERKIFKSETTLRLIEYVRKTYGDEPEYLWERTPENAIFRRKDNRKWYAAVLTVKKDRFGFDSSEPIEVLDLRAAPEEIAGLTDGKTIFPGYHMNKKHWITLLLDGTLGFAEIRRRLDESYERAKKG